MIFLDLVSVQIIAAVTDQDGLSQSLVQGMTQVLPVVGDQVEIGYVQNIITIDLILHINGLSIVSTAQQLDLLGLLLVVALLITHSLQFSLTGISTTGADTAIRRLVNAIDNTGHPSIIGIQDLRLSRVDELVLGHQHTHGLLIKCIVLQLVLLLIDFTSLSETADAGLLGQLQNLIHGGVSQNVLLTILLLVKHIVLHAFSSFIFIIIVIIVVIVHFTNKSIYSKLLLLIECLKHISNGLFAIGLSLLILFVHSRFLLIDFILSFYSSMDHNVFIPASIQFINFTIERIITMSHNEIDISAGVSTSQNQTQFFNVAMKNFLTTIGTNGLTKFICPDRQRTYISILHKFFCCLARFGVIKIAISIDTFITILKKRMPKDRIWIVMLMVKNQGNFLSVIILECVFLNNSTIATNQIVTSRPSRKIAIRILGISHFDFLLPY